MTRAARPSAALADWLAAEGLAEAAGPGSIADREAVLDVLLAAARARRSLSYSDILVALGHRFTRPKMRALCRTLDAIDAERQAAGRAPLAVLVVRESDRLPGQGWWIDAARRQGFTGDWTGPGAAALVRRLQEAAFDDVAGSALPPIARAPTGGLAERSQKRRANPA